MTWGNGRGGSMRWWVPLGVVAVGVEVALVFLWVQAPDLYAAATPGDGRAQAIALTRTGILTAAAGLVALAAALANLMENRRATNLTQARELYVAAAGQLGSDTLDVRLAGIYALERIARDSVADHRTVVDVLSAFVREHSIPGRAGAIRRGRRPSPLPTPAERAAGTVPTGGPAAGLDTDIQAALTILGRLPRRTGIARADLTGAQLPAAQLTNANLSRAYLDGANLSRAYLDGANLSRAYLDGANLTHARLDGANLTHARLDGANLTDARLDGANLTDAYLDGANLTDAYLDGANFTDARLVRANLTDAYLGGANFTDALGLVTGQLAKAIGGVGAVLPVGVERPGSWSRPDSAAGPV